VRRQRRLLRLLLGALALGLREDARLLLLLLLLVLLVLLGPGGWWFHAESLWRQRCVCCFGAAGGLLLLQRRRAPRPQCCCWSCCCYSLLAPLGCPRAALPALKRALLPLPLSLVAAVAAARCVGGGEMVCGSRGVHTTLLLVAGGLWRW
jgi:hypothetical protein